MINFWNWIGLSSAADIRELKEVSLRQTETLTELNKDVIQLLENLQNIEEKSNKLAETVHMYYDGVSKMLLKQSEAFSTSLEPLKMLQLNFKETGRNTQRTLEQVLMECKNQNELLRLLIANSLIDDVSKTLDEGK